MCPWRIAIVMIVNCTNSWNMEKRRRKGRHLIFVIAILGYLMLISEGNMDRNAVLTSVYDVIKWNHYKNTPTKDQLKIMEKSNRRFSTEPIYEIIKRPEEDDHYLNANYEQ